MVANAETDIWQRIVEPSWEALGAEAALGILRLGFKQNDIDRMNQLAELARQGNLSDEQQTEIDTYTRIGHMLAVMQSKARMVLKEPAGR
ncbi:MAG TPA: hypothetical protein VKK61_10285 [Tepidisphaeraceae bacterium]|nr:hypothetical protein [Tepidisphaeraceae bacterium]